MRRTWHTGDCGGGGLVLAVVIGAAVLLGSGAASAAVSAVASLIMTLAIVVACVLGAAVLGVIAVLAYRVRQDRPRAVYTARPVTEAPREQPVPLTASQPAAIEPPRNELHLHFHGMTPAEAAEAIRQASKGR